ncbi:MAG: FecR domain-containing protein [Parvularculaceae bacterium]
MVIALVVFAPTISDFVRPSDETGYYSTSIGETRMIAFADGSSVTLNTNSILEQGFSGKQRIVRLMSGEAIFDVAHDKSRPFLVYAADGVIRAVGTRFAVRVEPDNVSVTVTEGRVEMQRRPADEDVYTMIAKSESQSFSDEKGEPRATAVLVQRGEAGEISRIEGASKQPVTERDVAERLSWTNGQLIFYDKELQSVIEEVARYTPARIMIEDEALKKRKITGIIQIGDVSVMLDTIEQSLGVKAEEIAPNLIYLNAG